MSETDAWSERRRTGALTADVVDGLAAWAASSDDLVFAADADGTVTWMNAAARSRFGVGDDAAVNTADLLPRSALALYVEEIRPRLLVGRSWSGELTLVAESGPFEAWVSIVGGVDDAGEVDRLTVVARDLTASRHLQREMSHLATHDELTGLANRVLLGSSLERALARSSRDGTVVAVVFIDLDGLKAVNDTFGHSAGDALLREAGRRMARSVRPMDLVARVGGDEFVLLLEGLAARGEALEIASRVQLALESEPVKGGGWTMPLSGSFGVASSRAGDVPADVLLEQADTAMYEAKIDRSRAIAEYDDELHHREQHRAELGEELATAVSEGRVRPHFLAVVDLAAGGAEGWHALARWEHEQRGVLVAEQFVDSVAGTAAAVALDLAMIRDATGQAHEWDARQRLDVSISSRTLVEPRFPDLVAEVLAERELPRGQLGLRVPESVLGREAAPVARALASLRRLGVRIAVGGVGRGALAVRTVVDDGVHELVLARELVEGLPNRNVRPIGGIVGLAHGMGIKVTAVGVATPEQRRALVELGCDLGEGHLFGPPAPNVATVGREDR